MQIVTQLLAALLLVQAACALGVQRITGGKDAFPGQFPYQVSIHLGLPIVGPFSQSMCGGSIIADYWVLTSAGCLYLVPNQARLYVKAGRFDLKTDGEFVQRADVQLRLIHPDYKIGLNQIRTNDIALLKLKTPLIFNERVQPIQLPTASSQPSGIANLTGWGSISKYIIPKLPKVLQVAQVAILSEENCLSALKALAPAETLVGDLQFCSGPLDSNIAACFGDFGGPLVQLNSTFNTQIGIATWAPYPCGGPNSPTVYTLVSAYTSWIEDRIEENS